MRICFNAQSAGNHVFTGVEMTKKPAKVVRHFPIILKLRRMYGTTYLSIVITWWCENYNKDGVMRFPSDSSIWRHVDSHFKGFR